MKRILPLLLLLSLCLGGCAVRADWPPPVGDALPPVQQTTQFNQSLASLCGFAPPDARFGLNPPIRAYIRIERGEGQGVYVAASKELRALYEALVKIRVVGVAEHCDAGGSRMVSFITADGQSCSVRFNGTNLEYADQLYRLEDTQDFWRICGALVDRHAAC